MLLSVLLFPAIIDGPYLHSFLFMRLSRPLCRPSKPPDRRDGEITLSLGGPKVIIGEVFNEWWSFVNWQLLRLVLWRHTSCECKRRNRRG